jgi:hypothetical protein
MFCEFQGRVFWVAKDAFFDLFAENGHFYVILLPKNGHFYFY